MREHEHPAAFAGLRVFAPPDAWAGGWIRLDAGEARHLAVMRRQAGDPVTVLDGEGAVASAALEHLGKKDATLKILDMERRERTGARLHLALALIKNTRLDWFVEKATEMGLDHLHLLSATRCIVRPSEHSARAERLRALAISAIKQCGGPRLPVLHPPVTVEAWVRGLPPGALACYGSFEPGRRPFRVFLDKVKTAPASIREVWMAVGPEGDFTPDEQGLLRDAGAMPVDLGSQVLRAETAALYMIAAARYELDVWNPESQ